MDPSGGPDGSHDGRFDAARMGATVCRPTLSPFHGLTPPSSMSSLLSAESFRAALYASEARLRRWPWDQVWADLRLPDGTALPLDVAVSWLSAVCLVVRPDCNQQKAFSFMQVPVA